MSLDVMAEPRSDAPATEDTVFCSSCGTSAKRGTKRCPNRSCGVFLRRNPGRPQQTGVVAYERHGIAVLSPEFREAHDQFRAAVITDQGGESELSALAMSYVDRLAQIDTVLNLLT